MHLAYSLLGIVLILAVAVLLSDDRKAIRLRVVGAAFALQAGLAALVLYFPPGNRALQAVAAGVSSLLGYAHAGVEFLFGRLARPEIFLRLGSELGPAPRRTEVVGMALMSVPMRRRVRVDGHAADRIDSSIGCVRIRMTVMCVTHRSTPCDAYPMGVYRTHGKEQQGRNA